MSGDTWLFFFLMTLICVITEGFFSSFEMACVSINKVRLQYFASKGMKRALWLTSLLNKPSYLFGTILISINTVLQLGSEYSRRFYESLGLHPGLAPITQIIIVLIIGELAPGFAGRRHPEQVALLSVPIVYFLSKILTPFVWVIDKISQAVNYFTGKQSESFLVLTKDEVQRAFEEKECVKDKATQVVEQVFSIEAKKAKDLMVSMDRFLLLTNKNTVSDVRDEVVLYFPYLYLFHSDPKRIIGCVQLKDLLQADGSEQLMNYANPPWFIIETTPVLQVLREFRHNRQRAAVVLDKNGKAIGILTLDQIIDELFGQQGSIFEGGITPRPPVVVERTLSGDMSVEEFNLEFQVILPFEKELSLEDMIIQELGHPPSRGDRLIFEQFEFQVIEPSLLGVKWLSVKSL